MTSDTVSTGDAARSRAVSEPGRGRRRRRPSGEAPPLPRQLNRSGRFWLTLAGAVLAVLILIGVSGVTTVRLDTLEAVPLQLLERLRTAPMTAVFRAVNNAVSPVILLTWWASLLVMVIWRRWRHLFVYIGTMFLVSNLASLAIGLIQRPRPLGVEIIGHWQGFAMPSKPVAVLAATLVNVLYALVPHGRLRDRGKWVVTGLLALVVLARLYLGVDHVSDDLVAIVLGVAIPARRLAAAGPERRLPRHLPARPGGPPGRDRPPRRGRGPGAAATSSASSSPRSSRSAWRVRAGPPRCASRSRASRRRTCSRSSTRSPTCARTAGTSSAAPCSTAGWRTRSRSTRSAGWSSTRTTCCT